MLHGNAALFVDGPDPNGVLLFAIAAAPQETAVALSGLSVRHFVDVNASALHTAGIGSPPLRLEEFDGGKFIRAGQWDLFDNIRFCETVLIALLHN